MHIPWILDSLYVYEVPPNSKKQCLLMMCSSGLEHLSDEYVQAAVFYPLDHKGKAGGIALSEPGLVTWRLYFK